MRIRGCALALLSALFAASTAFAATTLKAGGSTQFKVELTPELRNLAGRGQLSPVTHALVTVSVPENFNPALDWPVMVVGATSDRGAHSSRLLSARMPRSREFPLAPELVKPVPRGTRGRSHKRNKSGLAMKFPQYIAAIDFTNAPISRSRGI